LKMQLGEVRAEVEEARHQASEAKQEGLQMQHGIEASAAQVASLQAELHGKSKEADGLKTQLGEVRAEVEEVRHQASAARQQADLAASLLTCQSQLLGTALGLSSAPLYIDVDGADEDPAARGDVSEEFAENLNEHGLRQAFRIGRARLPAAGAASHQLTFPVSCKVIVKNDSTQRWPSTTALVHASGNTFELPLLLVGSVEPGESRELKFDLRILQAVESSNTEDCSTWVFRDIATSKPLGLMLVFEVQWLAPWGIFKRMRASISGGWKQRSVDATSPETPCKRSRGEEGAGRAASSSTAEAKQQRKD